MILKAFNERIKLFFIIVIIPELYDKMIYLDSLSLFTPYIYNCSVLNNINDLVVLA